MAVATGDLGARGWMTREEGVIKLVADRRARACWSVPPWSAPAGGEIMSLLAVAVHAEVPIATLLHLHFAYPTYHRAMEIGAQGPRSGAVADPAWAPGATGTAPHGTPVR